MFELSSLLIPIISLASGIFFYLGAATTTLEAKIQPQNKPAPLVREHKNPNVWNLSQKRLPAATLATKAIEADPSTSLRASKAGGDPPDLLWQTESSSREMFLLSFPGDHPTTSPIEPLVMAKGSRAPPGGATSC